MVEHRFEVRAEHTIVRFEFHRVLKSGFWMITSKLCWALVWTLRLLSCIKLQKASASLMKFEAEVLLIDLELVSANYYKFSIALRRFSHCPLMHYSHRPLKVSIVFLSTGLLTDVVLFLNAPYEKPAEFESALLSPLALRP